MKEIHPVALFRYSVLGPLVSRAELQRGDLKAILQELAACHYDIPGSRNGGVLQVMLRLTPPNCNHK